jgi:hypothetical protein
MAIKVEVEFDREKLREYVAEVISTLLMLNDQEETRPPLTGTIAGHIVRLNYDTRGFTQQIAEDAAQLMRGQ